MIENEIVSSEETDGKSNLRVIQAKRIETENDFIKNPNTFFDVKNFSGMQCSKSFYYFNHTREEILVGERDGIQRKIPNLHNGLFRGLVVKVTYEFSTSVKTDIHNLSNSNNANDNKIAEAFITPIRGSNFDIVNIYYIFEEDEIISKDGKTIYIKDLDITVNAARNAAFMSHHPYYSEGMFSRYVNSLPDPAQAGSGVNFLLIDSNKKIRERFINFNGIIIKVEARSDSEMSDGLYVYSDHVANGELESKRFYNRYSLEEMETDLSSVVFKSYDTAVNFGNRAHIEEMEKLTREKEKTSKEIELEKERLRHKERDLRIKEEELNLSIKANQEKIRDRELEEKLDKMRKEEEYRRKENESRMKDYYDSRSYSRKDSNESLKVATAVIGTVGTLALLYAKFAN